MKTDINGFSTCTAGNEHYESFRRGWNTYVQYDYRTPAGKLYSCIGQTLEDCRAKVQAQINAR